MSDIVVTRSNPTPALWTGGTWEDLTRDAYEVFGADLEAGAQLIGVPMCLIKATFRQGDYADKNGVKGFYVSLDTIIGPQEEIAKAIRRKRIPEDVTPPEPGEHLVFNEGGTGVYRQMVSYLEETGRIRIRSDLPREGGYGESRLDIPPTDWEVDESAEFRKAADEKPSLAFNLRILCPRGLRSSEYANDYSKAAVTRYIA